jgi:quercetin dioxygenase-like cupin family protein
MLVKKINDYPKEPVSAGVKNLPPGVDRTRGGPHFAMRRFIIGPGGEMPLHTNTVEHEQFVIAGRARWVLGREAFEVKKHDLVFVQAGVKHSYKQIGDEAFELLCPVPNEKDVMEIIR